MINWRDIRTFEQLDQFQTQFSELELHDRLEITEDMVEYIEEVRFNDISIEKKASTSRDKPLLRRPRGRRRNR